MPDYDISKLSVLVVDDNATNREVLGQQLAGWVKHTEMCASGADALALCESNYTQGHKLFDVMVVDMQMPSMNGEQLGRLIKQDARFKDIHLIMMTSVSDMGSTKHLSDFGFSACFNKPATQQNLLDALKIVADAGHVLASAMPLVTAEYIHSLDPSRPGSCCSEIETTYLESWPKGCCVLVVEDNPVNQEIMMLVLEACNVPCVTASVGQEAIEYLNSKHEAQVSVILMDCQMPVMDGFEATRRIRRGEAGDQYRDIPIIVATAYALKGDDEKCIKAEMNDYTTKPIEPEQLLFKLSKWVHRQA
jgi:CheY-like chemotaxis protein